MKRKWIPLLLLVLALLLTACGGENTAAGTAQADQTGQTEQADQAAPQSEEDSLALESCPAPEATEPLSAASVEKGGHYTARDDVLLYLTIYGVLPENYITTEEAQALGWTGDNLQEVAPGCSLGGDVFTDVENLTFRNLKYRSCDVDVEAQESRSQTQLVYVEDLSYIYYTEDGGESFRLLYRAT